MNLPKHSTSNKIAERGVTYVKQIVEDEFSWMFRKIPLEEDFGLDGYIDIETPEGYVTGKYFGVQIKTGESYFSEDKGYCWVFRGDNKHLNYYLNCAFPILIILVDLESKSAFWSYFNKNSIEQAGDNWKVEVLKSNVLRKESLKDLMPLVGEAIDYLPQLKEQWKLNSKMKESNLVLLSINKDEIESLNFSGFDTLKEKLLSSGDMIRKLRGKMSFMIDGYNDDQRELFEIPEVRLWIKEIIPRFKYWGYFLNMDKKLRKLSGLRILQACSLNITSSSLDKVKKGYFVDFELDELEGFTNNIFGWLNEICDTYHIEESINIEQSLLISQVIFNLSEEEIKKKKE